MRGELELGQLAIDRDDEDVVNNPKVKLEKEKIAQEFQFFIYSVLQAGIKLLCRYDIDTAMKHFLEVAISACYFRIKEFREKFMDIVQNKTPSFDKQQPSEHLEAPTPGIRQHRKSKTWDRVMKSAFDWEHLVYEQIPE